jgi:pyruvate formate lyase activating enzyme
MSAAPELSRAEDENRVRCLACGHRCLVAPGKTGVCRVRFNRDGRLRAPAGYVAGLQIDPIEKKPFYHAFAGSDALSFGMLGCDYHCSFCQNWVSSQTLRDDRALAGPRFISPGRIIELARQNHVPVLVSTYNEPLITADWAVEIFKLAKPEGITCGFVSNGNATPEVLEFLRPYVDLYKVDLKGFDDRHYRQLGGVLQTVLDTIRLLVEMHFWVEVVTLVVPGFNDSDEELRRCADFLASVSTDIPWHVTAFHPDYKQTDPGPTPPHTLQRAYELGRSAGLNYVYPGNLRGRKDPREDTRCSKCDHLLIERRGFLVTANHLIKGRCPACDHPLPGFGLEAPPGPSLSRGTPRPL